VPTRWMKHRAEDIADSISGVKDLDNRIRVAAEEPAAHGDFDTSTTTGARHGDTAGTGSVRGAGASDGRAGSAGVSDSTGGSAGTVGASSTGSTAGIDSTDTAGSTRSPGNSPEAG